MKKKTPLVIGLTGGIGMGKSTAAKMFEALGLPVFDADAAVRDALMPRGKAEKAVIAAFPQCVIHGWIDRRALFTAAFQTKAKVKKLEAILHPLVWKSRDAFIRAAKKENKAGVVLDIPLLFETGADKACDKTLCVYTDAKTQKERVLKRKNMTAAKLKTIQAQQWTITKKRMLADVSLDMGASKKQAQQMIEALWSQWSGEAS